MIILRDFRSALGTIRRTVTEVGLEIKNHRSGFYPDFVYSADTKTVHGHIPVFVYHSIDPREFESHLRFLSENDYISLTCDEFVACILGQRPIPDRAVLLTIDDGRASVWSHGFPLLKRYGLTAVVFLIPGYIRDATKLRPTLDDRPEGLSSQDPDLMTWPEIQAMARSGLVDFQSHTLFHHKVPLSSQILGFVGPRDTTAPFDIPYADGDEPDKSAIATLGYPRFRTTSRMSGQPAFRPDPAFISALHDAIRGGGGHRFFDQPDWEQKLWEVTARWRDDGCAPGLTETPDEMRAAIRHNLLKARHIIEAKIPGHHVLHLCLPYTIGSPDAVAAARETGHVSTFWGVLPGHASNRAGGDPFHTVRLKADFLMRLPGRGRVSLTSILLYKILRRLSGRAVY